MDSNNDCSITTMPPEILVQIGNKLDKLEVILLARTCRGMYDITRDYINLNKDEGIRSKKQLWRFLAEKGYISLIKKLSINNVIINAL